MATIKINGFIENRDSKTTSNGKKVMHLFITDDENKQDYRVTLWGDQAEKANSEYHKKDHVEVTGPFYVSYFQKKDGSKGYCSEIGGGEITIRKTPDVKPGQKCQYGVEKISCPQYGVESTMYHCAGCKKRNGYDDYAGYVEEPAEPVKQTIRDKSMVVIPQELPF